jgi:hypothetical protein
MLDKEGYMHALACTRSCSRAPAHTDAHSHADKYVRLTAFPLQQWVRERASVLRYTYIACLVQICAPVVAGEIFWVFHWGIIIIIIITAIGLSFGGSSATLVQTKIKIHKTTTKHKKTQNTK